MASKFRKRHGGFELRSPPSASGSVRIVRRICYDDAERMVARKRARRLLDGTGEVIGYQLVGCKALATSVTVLAGVHVDRPTKVDSDPSSAVLSAAERDAAVGFYGESRTRQDGEYRREQRVLAGGREMDLVESAQVKLKAFEPVRGYGRGGVR